MLNDKSWLMGTFLISLLAGNNLALAESITPKAVYMEYRGVLSKSAAVDAILPFMCQKVVAQIKSTSPTDKEMFFGLIKSMSPQTVQIQSENIDGDKAVITLTAGDPAQSDAKSKPPKEKTTGTVTFLKENGKWKIEHESYDTKMVEQTPTEEK